MDTLVYNWAEAEYSSAGSDLTEFDRMLATLDGVRILPEHTGQRFCYSGVTFRILYTHEDMCPNYLRNVNDTSLVMRADFGQRRVLWTGDAMRETADLLCEQYAPEVLRCNVLQVAHHGYWGGSDALYRTVDPEVVLWPCPDFWFQALHKEECNRYLTESPNVKALFLSGQQEITLNMEAELLPVDPYALQNAAKPGELLLSEDFSGGNIYSLGWTGVTGGKTGYRSAALSLEESGCRMTAWPEQYSVCELMQPGALCMAESFTVRLVGFAERVGTAAMFWNYATPTVYCEEEALDLGLCAGEEFDLQLMVDGTAKRVSLQKNGKELHQAEFTPATQRGLYLILKDSEIVLHSVQVTR